MIAGERKRTVMRMGRNSSSSNSRTPTLWSCTPWWFPWCNHNLPPGKRKRQEMVISLLITSTVKTVRNLLLTELSLKYLQLGFIYTGRNLLLFVLFFLILKALICWVTGSKPKKRVRYRNTPIVIPTPPRLHSAPDEEAPYLNYISPHRGDRNSDYDPFDPRSNSVLERYKVNYNTQ